MEMECENIMNAHIRTGAVPDPFLYPEAALKVLRGHYEVMEHATRLIELSNMRAQQVR